MIDTTAAFEKYADSRLKSELAQFCLPEAKRDPNRNLAWVNSICMLFLVVGIFGARHASLHLKRPAPLEQPIPAIVEPPPPPPPARIEPQQNPEPPKEATPQVAQPVVVTLDSPAVNFSVPTIGSLVVPNGVAVAPPSNPLNNAAPTSLQALSISSTGSGGDRPAPDYPPMAKQLHEQGLVLLRMSVDGSGRITDIKVQQSSGSRILDHYTLDFVRRHWILPSGTPGRIYEAPINYVY